MAITHSGQATKPALIRSLPKTEVEWGKMEQAPLTRERRKTKASK